MTIELFRQFSPTTFEDELLIGRADPEVWVSDEVLGDLVSATTANIFDGRCTGWTHPLGWLELEYIGPESTVMRINGRNRQVTYVLDRYDHQRNAWHAVWPD